MCAPSWPAASRRSTRRVSERVRRGKRQTPCHPSPRGRQQKRPGEAQALPAPLLCAQCHRANSSQKSSLHPPTATLQRPRTCSWKGAERETQRPMSEALQMVSDCFWESEGQEGVGAQSWWCHHFPSAAAARNETHNAQEKDEKKAQKKEKELRKKGG